MTSVFFQYKTTTTLHIDLNWFLSAFFSGWFQKSNCSINDLVNRNNQPDYEKFRVKTNILFENKKKTPDSFENSGFFSLEKKLLEISLTSCRSWIL